MLGSAAVGYSTLPSGVVVRRALLLRPPSPGRRDTTQMALLQPLPQTDPSAYHLAAHRIRRCTFRRLIQVDGGPERVYDVECLYPERRMPIPLGDLETAMPICNACTAAHIFRPDED